MATHHHHHHQQVFRSRNQAPKVCFTSLPAHIQSRRHDHSVRVETENVVMGDWEYPIIYGFEEKQWTDLLQRWKEAAEKFRNGERAVGPRTLVELRGNWPSNWPAQHFQTRIMPDVDALKKEYGEGSGYECEITTSVLIREPTSQTLSFYEYYIRKQQEQDPGEKKTMWPGVVGKESWGHDIGDYVSSGRATNGQVREILGDRCTTNLREPGYETEWVDATNKPVRTHARPIAKECKITESDYERFENVLRWFDVVGTTDNFDHFLLAKLVEWSGFDIRGKKSILENTRNSGIQR